MQSNVALIVAGGSGSRFNSATPKQYHSFPGSNLTILQNTINIFKTHPLIDLVSVVIGQGHNVDLDCPYSYGGSTRQESVRNGLNFLRQYNPKNVLIHDAVRPFISHEIISQVIEKLKSFEAVDIGLPIVDTVKTYSGIVIPRESIYSSQTPQGFHFDLIAELHETSTCNYSDDISLYLASGRKNLSIVAGDTRNKKITYREDIDTN